ncbi:MAG: hypothetical protein HRF43_04965 [Phycisphaerae bacterium]|jgi:hypothetical protein
MMQQVLQLLVIGGFSWLVWGPAPTLGQGREGDPVDVAPFGQVMSWEADGKDQGILWEDARDIFRVVVVFEGGSPPPNPGAVRLEYWQSGWPQRRIPRDQPSGAGGSGWLDIGDWYNGRWRPADTKLEVSGSTFAFSFNPLNIKEFPNIKDFPAAYRTTLKLRIVGEAALPRIERFQAFTDSVYKPLAFEVEWGGTAKEAQAWDGRLEVFNGRLEGVEPLAEAQTVQVGPDQSWRSTVQGATAGIRARILYAEPKGYNSFDETVVTVRAAHETFSFSATDLVKAGRIFIPDFGVLVRKAGENIPYARAEQVWRNRGSKDKDLYSRVFDMPEQTFTQAWNDTPAKAPHYIPISFEGSRQHFRLDEEGNVVCFKHWQLRVKGKDTDRCQWEGNLRYRFGLPAVPPRERHLVDGYLPIMVGTWEAGGVRYTQTVFAVPLLGIPAAGGRIWADDTLVLMARIGMEKIGPGRATAEANLKFSTAAKREESLVLQDDLAFVAADTPTMLRMRISAPDPAGEPYSLTVVDGRIVYQAVLTTEKPSRTLDVAIPYITLTEPREFAVLRGLRFDEQLSAVGGYWQRRIAAGCRIDTPERMINDFYRADAAHLLINTEREVGVSDRYMPKVGTFNYGVYPNESCMMLLDLEVRGYPKLVERALDSWLHYQGTVPLPGDFTTADGVFYGAGRYEMGEYNQSHGWVLWMMGEHYWFTRDRDWLARAAPRIIKGCDWVTQQRQHSTRIAAKTPIRAIERGLLPMGRLEDIGDWRTWLSTNVYTWWGCRNAALALEAIGHPEAGRLKDDAAGYHKDLLAAYTEAMRRSPVVRLRDGSWIPKVPSDVHRRGRSFGWITETLEGAIHLVRTGALEPHDRLSTWIIKDFEDNLYLSEQFGYELKGPDFERFWFSLGGTSMQANLLHNPVPYLLRDEPKHFLRAYFNAFAVSYFPDTRMMTEHALPNIGDWRGDHFKSSDESNSTYWLRCMFVQERGEELLLGYAVPRYWLADGQRIGISNVHTYFGPMSMRMASSAGRGTLEMTVEPPRRNPPKVIRARFRHPDALRMTRCEVNGKPFDRFDPADESVELPGGGEALRIIAYYDPAPPRGK